MKDFPAYVPPKYLEPGDPGSFDDMSLLPKPDGAYAGIFKDAGVCPKCKGYGGWNLSLNDYGPGKHFKAGCGHCNGWGWSNVLDHVHEWVKVKSLGHCLSLYECSVCGAKWEVDSSD